MSLPRNVTEIVRERVTLEVEGIDRLYLNVYVSGLQYESGVAACVCKHRGHALASSALMAPISAFVAVIHAFAHALGRDDARRRESGLLVIAKQLRGCGWTPGRMRRREHRDPSTDEGARCRALGERIDETWNLTRDLFLAVRRIRMSLVNE